MSEFLRSPELDISKGSIFSVPSFYLGAGNNYPQNMQLYRGEMKKRDGRTTIGPQSIGAGKVLHLGLFEITNGTQRLIRHTKQNVERYIAASNVWENITGIDLTGTELDFFDSCVVTESDLYLFTNYVDNIRKYDDSGTTQNLGGAGFFAKTIDYVTPYVLAGNVLEGGNTLPQKLKWSDTGAPETWAGGNSGSVLLSDEPSPIHKIKKLNDYAMVYKEKSIYRGRKVSTDSIFDFGGPFQIGKGCASPRSITDDGSIHYYMGTFDFHLNNGVRVQDIGGPIREYVFNRLNRTRIHTCHAVHVELYKEIWFFVTVGAEDWPTEVWKYAYDTGFWYFDTVQNCISASNYRQTTDLTWDTDPGTWDEEVTYWDDQSGLTDAPFNVFGYADGWVDRLNTNTITDRGVAVTSRIDTKDYSGIAHNGVEFNTRWMQFDLWARGEGEVSLYYSTNYGSNWTFVKTKTLGTDTEKLTFWFDKFAPHIRFRIQTDDLITIRNFTPYYLAAPEDPS